MLVVNELCCCNFCGKIRSTVRLYLRDGVRRFSTTQPIKRTPNGLYRSLRISTGATTTLGLIGTLEGLLINQLVSDVLR